MGTRGDFKVALLALASLLMIASVFAPAANAAPAELWTKCTTGTAAEQCSVPRGVESAPLTAPNAGHIFVADQTGRRVSEFTAWGVFVKTWGWDVVASGPGDDVVAPEDQFEICLPDAGDTCKAGVQGNVGVGQFGTVAGIAVDSAGNVYVFDPPARRVQKFSPSGQFLLMFGGGVNQGGGTPANPGNVCTAQHIANGDVCGAGATGSANGQFGAVQGLGDYISVDTLGTAVATDDKVYAGDVGRIQRFDSDGVWQASIAVPETTNSLATDATGNLYVTYINASNNNKPNVRKLDPAQSTASELCQFEASNPRAVAIAPDGEVYAFNKNGADSRILRFSSTCSGGSPPPPALPLESFPVDSPSGLSDSSTGLAVNNCDTSENSVYHSNNNSPFVRAFSEPPDPDVCGDPPIEKPVIDRQYAIAVDTDSARVGADINPEFFEDTVYYVQYATAACIEAGGWEAGCVHAFPSPPGVPLNGGVVDVPVSAAPLTITELEPGVEYLYRFVAESSGGGPVYGVDPDGNPETNPPEASILEGLAAAFTTFPDPSAHKTDCPNQGFRTGASARLPDCRAYELVSPVDKEGGEVDVLGSVFSLAESATDGDAFTYSSLRAFGDPRSANLVNQYLARRDAGSEEWRSEAITAPREGDSFSDLTDQKSHYKAFSEDLCNAWNWESTEPTLAPGALVGFPNLYRRDNCGPGTGSFEALTTVVPPDIERVDRFLPEVQGFSADGSLSVFRAAGQLAPGLVPCGSAEESANICTKRVYASQGGELSLVSVLPDGTPSEIPSSAGTAAGLEGHHTESLVDRAVSADGSKVFWTAGSDGLYVRLNPMAAETAADLSGNCIPDPALACTVEIVEASFVRFWSAAADGHKAIYSVGVLNGPTGADLYEFDLATPTPTSTLIAEGVRGVAGTSRNGSDIYYVSTEVETPLPNVDGDVAQLGQPNLYHYEMEGGGPESETFVATLAGADAQPPESNAFSPGAANPDARSARVTPDGSHLAFTSSASLTGYDNTDLTSGEPDLEVFLYEAASGELVCVSCNPSGARPAGREVGSQSRAATIPPWPHQLHPSRALSEDGERLFFESYDGLVLADTNGRKDVYEWEAVEGEGGGATECRELGAELYVEASDGCLSLISSGTSPLESDFLDASADGRDVFFRTASSLLAHDPGLLDVYDAREGGGLPAPPSLVAPCEGEACQSPATPPGEVTPASAAFSGPGNVTPKNKARRCPKGKRRVVRRGKARCVAKKKHRRADRRNHRRAQR
ncbi:MAG TPA: hypothetical protein VFY04_08725 [Solirubrobacterales bacterium]|nr:hypothetical protein [Solirubrobacterales bacterium]